jgi:HK97 family phage prohead protease
MKGMPMFDLSRDFPADIEIRSGGSGRTVHGIVVPFGQVAEVSDGGRPPYREQFAPGSFARDIATRAGNFRGVKMLYQHNRVEPIGRATMLREDGAGLYGEFHVSDTTRGNEALSLLRDGVLDSFSVGFRPQAQEIRDGVTVRTKAQLREASLVTFPAYAGALVAGVRSLDPSQVALLSQLIETIADSGDATEMCDCCQAGCDCADCAGCTAGTATPPMPADMQMASTLIPLARVAGSQQATDPADPPALARTTDCDPASATPAVHPSFLNLRLRLREKGVF